MPKEQINYAPVVTLPDGTTLIAPEISLHWSGGPAGYAQLGMEFSVSDMLGYLNHLLKGSPTDSRATFYTPELTRPDLQRLVKAARRARDVVFDADE